MTGTARPEEFDMIGWIVRMVMAVAGVITGWFVATDAANFGLIQMVVSILLMTFFIAVAAFWPNLRAWLRHSPKPDDRKSS
jgi:hypothetical protein